VEKPWVNFEAEARWVRDIPVIPLCHSGIQQSNLPMPLNLLQAANLNSVSGLKLLLPLLAKFIDSNAPNYDFTDFVDTVKAFEKNILYCQAVGDRISGDGSATKFCLSPLGNFP